MNEKLGSKSMQKPDVPYDSSSEAETTKFWETATPHLGIVELRTRLGRPSKSLEERKEQIALRVDKEVLDWYRAQGAGWQTRMNAVLRAFRDATI